MSGFGSYRKRCVVALAASALLLQLCLGFAHVHSEDFPRAAQAGSADLAAADDDHDNGRDRAPADHRDCAICVALHQLASSALPVVQGPAFHAAAVWLNFERPASPQATVEASNTFDARGPPKVV